MKIILIFIIAIGLNADMMCEHYKKSFEQGAKKMAIQIEHGEGRLMTCFNARILKSNAINILSACELNKQMEDSVKNMIKIVDNLKCD